MQEFLKNCIKVERTMAEIYSHLASCKAYREELRRAFREMARDEMEHAQLFTLVLEIPEYQFSLKDRKTEQIKAFLSGAQALREALGQKMPEEVAALRLSLDLEQEFLQIHFGTVTSSNIGKINGLLQNFFQRENLSSNYHLTTAAASNLGYGAT